jgi:hypothetical protein
MTIDEVDRALAEWQSRLRRIDENLVALQLDPVHLRLEQSRDGGLDGVTRDRVLPALTAMRELFAQRGLLYDMLRQATRLRAGFNRRKPAETLREIERLLRGPSIVVPAVEHPLGRRSLLDTAETAIAPDQLLSAMISSFEQARDAVAAVDQAWQQLAPECKRASAEADRLQAIASGLGEDATATLAAVRAQLDAVEGRISRDPLGATQSLTEEVFEHLRQLEQQLAELQHRRDQVRADLDRAHALLAGVRAADEHASTARERCGREIAPAPGKAPPPPPLDTGRIEGLARWLATLEATAGAGRWSAATVGLARWLNTAQGTLAEAEAAERACVALLEQRDELLGRLLARRQQARVRAARGQAVDPAAEHVATRAERLLRQVPTPLSEAATLVADYEAQLRATREGNVG